MLVKQWREMEEHEQTLVKTEKEVNNDSTEQEDGVLGLDCPKCEKTFEGRIKLKVHIKGVHTFGNRND